MRFMPCAFVLSCVHLFAPIGTVAHQTPLSTEFSRQEYWSGLPFPTPGDLPYPGIEPTPPAGGSFTTDPTSVVMEYQTWNLSAVIWQLLFQILTMT